MRLDEKKERLSRNLFYAGIAVAVFAVVIYLLMTRTDLVYNLVGAEPCYIYSHFGIYCPGCGGTRAIYALAEGRILDSILYHPIVIYCAAIYVVYMCSYGVFLGSGRRVKHIYYSRWWLIGAIVLIFVQWSIKVFLQLNCGYEII